jgi:pSer/pThr/pTyr-binding forkhead associated (FHA) protein
MSTYWLKYRGTRFPIRRGETLLGRSPYCSIVLSNPLASRQHCALKLDGGSLTISDLESANGTWVNGERVEGSHSLSVGDLVRIGTDVLEVMTAEEETVRSSQRTDHGRKVTGQAHMSLPPEALEEATNTKTHATTLDLLEQLVASAGETRRPSILAPSIQRVVEALLDQSQRTGQPLGAAEATRVAAAVEKLSSWFADGSLSAWRQRTLKTLQSAS